MAARHKSGPASTVETHPQFAQIELAIANDISARIIAEKFGVGMQSVYRHRRRMSPERIAMLRYRTEASVIDLDRLKKSEAESVVQRAVVKMADLEHLMRLATDVGDARTAVMAAKTYQSYLELQAKFCGELITGDTYNTLIVTESPEYRRLVGLIMGWVANDPDKGAELAAFLEQGERAALNGRDAAPMIEAGAVHAD